MAEPSLRIYETFVSLQGESRWQGLPCSFIRLSGCDVGCSYCDTQEAHPQEAGSKQSFKQICHWLAQQKINLVELTGGEPLQQQQTLEFLDLLAHKPYTILLETSGTEDITQVNSKIHIIMDLKTPSSGVSHKMRYENFALLSKKDELKIVVESIADCEWAYAILQKYQLLAQVGMVSFSPVHDRMPAADLAAWLLEKRLAARLQLQLHKLINIR